MSVLSRRSFIALALLAAGACHRGQVDTGEELAPTYVEVDNQQFNDADIYVVTSGGQRIRLGMVTGNAKARLRLPDSLVTGATQLRFLARPLAGLRPEIGESIVVNPGDTISLVLPPG